MSGEGMIGVAVVAVVGGSVWLAARGVQAGALVAARSVDLLGAGLTRIGDRAERNRAEWEAGHAELLAWESAARGVIDLNARIEVLRTHAPADLAAGLPQPLTPCAESPAELASWCTATRARLERCERELRQRTEVAVLSVLRHTVDLERPVTAQEAFDKYHEAMARQAARKRATPPAALAAVTRILGRLTPDATAEERAKVLAAAAQVAVPRPDVDPGTLLEELRLRVQRADARARTRRADAISAARLLQAIPAGAGEPALAAVRTELASVVAAQRPLDAGLRARAAQAAEAVRRELEHGYVRASVADTLAGQGYTVDEGFSTVTGHPDRLRLVRRDWQQHAVQLVINEDEVRAAVIRLEDRPGADARREDVEREEQWCDDLGKLRTALDGSGLHVVERHLVPPGERVVPVAKRAEPAHPVSTREQRRRERDR
ncbi:hypothetical protein [Amycolatopsis sp. CA-128772]|uniref:hypothetical protein n=1 Tax=Amycolatopsis sp. CA-128772 TaxID=2073159 RepID=UPI000CD1AD34|nr:hypothetical protein [Amycolatopsis sp. CA-128772]